VCILKIANYATLSQRLDVEDLDEVLHRYYQSCEEVINEFEGSIVNQHSEKLLTYFGYPKSHEDDAFRAVRCGLKILDDIVRLNNELQQKIKIIAEEPVSLKISIHSGSVMLTSNSVNYTPIGKALTLVDQLNALAKTNLLVISADTHRQIKGGFTCSSLGYVNFEGISAPQEIYQVINENSHHSRFDFRRSSGLTPLVGRKSEIGWLLECWSRIKEGQGEVMQISGIPGIGKSRLIHDFKLLIQQDSYTLLECQCWEHKETTPFGPLIELLERLLDFSQADPVEQKLSKLEAVLSKYGFALTEIMPLFVMLLSFPVTRAYPSIKQKTANQRRRTIDSILSLLFKIAEEKPLLVIVEDLHWADPSTLELLGLFVRQAPTYHVFFLFTFRPEFIPPWYNQPSYITQMNLRTLMPEHARSIVTNTAGGKKLPSEITEQLLTSTEGVPLFIEEWTKAILESGILERRETSYEFSDASLGLDIPTTLHELLLVRLDRLGSAKEVAQLGAVIGRQFSYELIRLISPLKEKALQKELDRLVAAELLFTRGIPPKSSYLFKHSLIQDTAYNALPKARKIQLHKSIAQALIDKFPEVVSTQPELLAHHYTAADLREQAVDYWHRAGNKALDRFALSESIGHFNKALEMLQMLTESAGRDRQELEIRLSLGTALSSKCYASPEVEKCYAKAFELSRQLSDFSQLFPVLRGLWCCYIGQAKFQLAKETCEQLLTLASEEGDLVHLIEANRTMGVILLWTGKLDLARDYLEQGSALYAQQQVRSNSLVYGIDPGAICLIYTAWVLLFMGYPERASRIRDEALTLSGEIGHPFTQAFTYTFAAWFNQFSRDCSGAYKMAIQAVARSSEFGFNQWLSWGRILLGWALAGQGDEEGLEQVKLGLTEARADSLDHGLSAFLALQSDIHSKLDQFSQSLVILNEAIDFANASGERFYEAELYRNKGELLLAHTSFGEAEAETLFRRAFDVAHCQGAKLFELRAVSSLARLLHRQGRAQEALKLMESSYAWFTEGFETPDLKDAQELIQILSGKDDKELR
jgi:class 3 adenylate cyclase/predicted ATPase